MLLQLVPDESKAEVTHRTSASLRFHHCESSLSGLYDLASAPRPLHSKVIVKDGAIGR